MSTPVDPYAVPDHLAERFLDVRAMAEALTSPDSPEFFVLLTQYFIEGTAYMASGLTVSATATPNLVQTQTGFVCEATFPTELLAPDALRGKTIHDGTATVTLEARLEDILQIIGNPD
jgi:hypothetical protein